MNFINSLRSNCEFIFVVGVSESRLLFSPEFVRPCIGTIKWMKIKTIKWDSHLMHRSQRWGNTSINCSVVWRKIVSMAFESKMTITESSSPDEAATSLHFSGGNVDELPLTDCRWCDDDDDDAYNKSKTEHTQHFRWLHRREYIAENGIYIRQIGFQHNFSIWYFFLSIRLSSRSVFGVYHFIERPTHTFAVNQILSHNRHKRYDKRYMLRKSNSKM